MFQVAFSCICFLNAVFGAFCALFARIFQLCISCSFFKCIMFRLHIHCTFLFYAFLIRHWRGAFVRPDLSNECAIPNILKALRFCLHFHCIFLFPCISKQAFNKCPFSTHEMCSSCHLTNHFFPQPFFWF